MKCRLEGDHFPIQLWYHISTEARNKVTPFGRVSCMTKLKIPKHMSKCKECPYKIGLIKCVKNPCPDCIASGEKTDPFKSMIKK